eukprot:scaffold1053_cov332-Pavlova_lutheri.AAC.18
MPAWKARGRTSRNCGDRFREEFGYLIDVWHKGSRRASTLHHILDNESATAGVIALQCVRERTLDTWFAHGNIDPSRNGGGFFFFGVAHFSLA